MPVAAAMPAEAAAAGAAGMGASSLLPHPVCLPSRASSLTTPPPHPPPSPSPQVFPEAGTVCFSAGLHGWAFTLTVFAKLYAKKFGE